MNGITRRTVSTVVILTIFILLFFYKLNNKKSNPLLSKKQNLDSKRKNPDTNSNNNKYAYASLLCDDVMIDATKVPLTIWIPFILIGFDSFLEKNENTLSIYSINPTRSKANRRFDKTGCRIAFHFSIGLSL